MKRMQIFTVLFLSISVCFILAAQSSFVEYGKAGYYGDEFHGRKTASGEAYNKNEYTCAHNSLPFGTKLRVTRLDNQKSVVVRVNDRGPFVKEMVVDISKKAAKEIDLIRDGRAKVKIEVVGVDSPTSAAPTEVAQTVEAPKVAPVRPVIHEVIEPAVPQLSTKSPTRTVIARADAPPVVVAPAATNEKQGALVEKASFNNYGMYQIEMRQPSSGKFGVQAVTLTNFEYVLAEIANLQGAFPGKVLLNIEPGDEDKPMYKLVVGPFASRKDADSMQKKVRKKGYSGAFSVEF